MRPGARIQFGVEPERSMVLPLADGTPPGPVFSALLAAHRGAALGAAFADAAGTLQPQFIDALISDLERADLVRRPPLRRTITIIGRDGLRTGLLEGLRRSGSASWTKAMSPTRNATLKLSQSTPEDIGLAVITGMEVPSLPLGRALYHRGIEHLHTHFRDGALIIGPLVRPGQGPCAMCFEAYRRDRDPVRSLIALQLRTFTPVAAPEWLNTAVPLLLGQLRRPDLSDLCATEVRIDMERLDITRTTVGPHPHCPVCGHGNSGAGFM
ncbi:MAG: TOMM precursor leader peptide-binding protein [Corynebacterium sp.]|uniref:TOMM precursor leader peptide-binding protein n=1 Tax=Corynebacterium sp. TaxID=1720 RepID=UPI0026DBE390|nr:TOMM precursor leader peptide-binding protein [Corynebacterium sp.]MDO5030761.1 TOMM precursor leader peptide-binding protein [Corynebacterium sp.]